MKKVFLHGELGARFGEEWDLDVDSPFEAISALFANRQEIEIYLNKKQKEGIIYGIKKLPSGEFIRQEDYSLPTRKNIHIFPVPQGSGNFALSLVMVAATTAASMYISKKMAEAMERDDQALVTQTQSFIFEGGKNRTQQGSAIPVGYGRMLVGSNVISSCVANYDHDAEMGKLISFDNGIFSIIPKYNKHYNPEAGPLMSSFVLNLFDGSSNFKSSDPAYQFLKKMLPNTKFGGQDGIYGKFVNADVQREKITNIDENVNPYINTPGKQGNVERKGNSLAGYFWYEWNYLKGVSSIIGDIGVGHAGNWVPRSQADSSYKVPGNQARWTSYSCVQSVPQLDTNGEEKVFYPITFAQDGELTYIGHKDKGRKGYFPISVGERWINANRDNGVGWFKMESASIYKTVDLICEGPIDGFCGKNGENLKFNKNPDKVDDPNDPRFLRNPSDDYLQGVVLDNYQVKEVNPNTNRDAYNINEFDIDIAQNKNKVIGSEDQSLLEPQYLFNSNTIEINAPLYGPRQMNVSTVVGPTSDLAEFEPKKTYKKGDYVSYQEGGGEKYVYSIASSLNEKFDRYNDYNHNQDEANIVYTGDENNAEFYLTTENINDYKDFSFENIDANQNKFYQQGDKVKNLKQDGGMAYYEMGEDAEGLLGQFIENETYTNQYGEILENGSAYYKITGDYHPGKEKQITEDISAPFTLYDFTQQLTVKDEEGKDVLTDIFYILQNTEDQDLQNKDWFSEVDITPDSSPLLWQKIEINGVRDIENGSGGEGAAGKKREDLVDRIFSLFGDADQESIRLSEEEYYVAHEVINSLVEEVLVTLQVDELAYHYEGDNIEVSYEIGELWEWLILITSGYYGTKSAVGIKEAADLFQMSALEAGAQPVPQIAASKKFSERAGAKVKDAAWDGSIAAGLLGLFVYIQSEDRWKIGNKIENSGEIWPNKAKFRIKYGNEGEVPYSTDVFMYGVATSPYRKDIKIYLPPNPSRKNRNIKVYKLNRERNPVKEGEIAARYKENFSLASVTEITPVQLSYPNSVVIGTRVNARDLQSIPERNYHLRLKRIAIPSNYDPETRQYDGNWDGKFKGQASKEDPVPEPAKQWTDNPAWCMYDLISDKRYGVGRYGIKPENIDRWTLYKIAKYCDEFINTGYSPKYKRKKFSLVGNKKIKINENYGADLFSKEFSHINKKLAIYYSNGKCESIKIKNTQATDKIIFLERNPIIDDGECAVEIDYPLVEPRYTLNAFIMSPENAFKVINEFASIFRSYAYWSGGAVNFFQDEKKESVMLFGNNNISKDGFSYSSTPKTSRTNSCKIKYLDKFNMFKAKMEYSEDRNSIQNNGLIEQTIDGFGITSQSQAKRAADFIVKTANMESEIVSFETSSIGSYLRPGDIIDVVDNKRTIGRFAGRITDAHVESNGRFAEISLDYPINSLIDKNDKDTWRNITIYAPSGNETIESLDEKNQVLDQEIDNIRTSQIKHFTVIDLHGENQKMTIANNPYSFISGSYSFQDAVADAEDRGGSLATVNSEIDQIMMQSVVKENQTGWLAGYYLESPPPSRFTWLTPQDDCGAENNGQISFENWAEGFPKVGQSIETNNKNEIFITDCEEYEIKTDPPEGFGDFIAVSGSSDLEVNGGWVTLGKQDKIGYILQKKTNESLASIRDAKGATFTVEDSVNLAKPNKYKIVNITESSNGVYKIQGIEYNEDKFDNIEKDLLVKEPTSPVIFTEDSIPPPSNISIEILQENISKNIPYGIRASWKNVQAAASYRVQFFNEDVLLSTFEVPNNKELETIIHDYRDERIVENGNYYVRVYSVAR